MRSINRSNSRADQKIDFLWIIAAVISFAISMQSRAGVGVLTWDVLENGNRGSMSQMVLMGPGGDVPYAVQRLNALPEGRRVLLLIDVTERLAKHPSDACFTVGAKGKVTRTSFFGPWCVAGEQEVRGKIETLCRQLAAAGVKGIDGVVLDNETTFHPGRFISGGPENLAAIERDPRYPALSKRLGIKTIKNMNWGSPEYYRWFTIVQPDFDAALDRAVATAFKARWPRVMLCNYGSAPIKENLMTPEPGGFGMVYGGTGYGTHNSLSFYGDALPWLRGRAFRGATLNDGAFDMFRMNVHRVRATRASSSKPLLPWIASRSLGQQSADGLLAPFAATDYWDENVIQLVMHGCDTLLLFNPGAMSGFRDPAVGNNPQDQARLGGLVQKLNDTLGSNPGKSVWFSLPGLQDRVMATGRRVTGGTMWRFSFAEGVASVTVAMKNGDVREIVPEAGEVGAWLFEADNNPFAAKVDGTDIAYAEAPAGAAWPDLDDSGELDQGDISLLLLDMNDVGSPLDINGDNVITNADMAAFKTIQKNWYTLATKGRTAMEGSVLVTAAR